MCPTPPGADDLARATRQLRAPRRAVCLMRAPDQPTLFRQGAVRGAGRNEAANDPIGRLVQAGRWRDARGKAIEWHVLALHPMDHATPAEVTALEKVPKRRRVDASGQVPLPRRTRSDRPGGHDACTARPAVIPWLFRAVVGAGKAAPSRAPSRRSRSRPPVPGCAPGRTAP